MKVLHKGTLPKERELKVKCNHCESELLGKLSEFKERVHAGPDKRIEAKYQINFDWWVHDLDMTSILEDIPKVKEVVKIEKQMKLEQIEVTKTKKKNRNLSR